jgi:hypothetical protein
MGRKIVQGELKSPTCVNWPEQRRAVENLLGRTLEEDESVSIKSIRPSAIIPPRLSPEERAEAIEKLREYFAKIDAQRKPVSETEEEAIINEAFAFSRPDYKVNGESWLCCHSALRLEIKTNQ